MAKKSYLDNPALNFISSAIINDSEDKPQEDIAKEEPSKEKAPINAPEKAEPSPSKPKAASSAAKPSKKAETSSKPVQLESPVFPNVTELEASKAAESERVLKLFYVEARSKRINVLMQPSLYEKLLSIAKYNGVSVNEVIHRACEEFCK